MDPSIWGPYGWTFLSYIALGFPSEPTAEDKITYKHFFMNIWKVLPCFSCGENYKKHVLFEMPSIDDYLVNGDKLYEWLWKLHNLVNKELGKREWKLEESKNALIKGGFAAKCLSKATNKSESHWQIILIVLIAVICFVLLWYAFFKLFYK
jgi:hypothetical protein